MFGSRKTVGATMIPAIEPIAAASPQPSASVQPTRMPTSRLDTGFCAAARIARPSGVKRKNTKIIASTTSVMALELTAGLDPSTPAGAKPTNAAVVEIVRQVARQIGNTQTVCRRFYIHPAVLESILAGPVDKEASGSTEGELLRLLSRRRRKAAA